MNVFMGEYQHTLDSKGRLILPAKIRDGLGDTFVATRGLDDCIFIYTTEEWAAFEGKLKQLSLVKPEARAFPVIFSPAQLNWKRINRDGCFCRPISVNMPGWKGCCGHWRFHPCGDMEQRNLESV